MKVKLTYEFDTQAEDFVEEEYYNVMHAQDTAYALWQIHKYLRTQLKYTENPDNIEKIYEKVCEIMEKNGVADYV